MSDQKFLDIDAPSPAQKAGLNSLAFNEDFTSLSIYSPTKNPEGTWSCNDFWMNKEMAGYVDFAGLRTFVPNQGMAGTGYTDSTNADALRTISPYFPVSQLDDTTARLTCTRSRLSERPELRALVNDIAVKNQGQQKDSVTWLGAFLTTEKANPFAQADITRPAYIEARLRFSPANTKGIFSSFWLYDTGEVTGSPEIDIFESNDHDPTFWKTNIHHSGSGPSFNLTHKTKWCDGNFHTFGLLWEPSSLKVYYDNVLSNELTGPNADFFSMPMRLMITHTCDAHWCGSMLVPSNIDNVYMDIDYIRVWKEGPPKLSANQYDLVVNSISLSPESLTADQPITFSVNVSLNPRR